jgi:hypothetical protein
MTALAWPAGLQDESIDFELETQSRSGGQSVSGAEQIVASPAIRWRAEVKSYVRGNSAILAYRAFKGLLKGRFGTVLVPVCDGRTPTYMDGQGTGIPFSDGAFFSDGTGWSQPRYLSRTYTYQYVGDILIFLQSTNNILPGMYFSINNRLYLVTSVAGSVPDLAVNITPPLRETLPIGSFAIFDAPVCEMRLASDNSGSLSLTLNKYGSPVLSFVEAL